jgi:hypothetical protein
MNIESALEQALQTYQDLNISLLSEVYDETGAIMMRAMNSYIKNGFTREEAFEILKVQIPDFKVTLR